MLIKALLEVKTLPKVICACYTRLISLNLRIFIKILSFKISRRERRQVRTCACKLLSFICEKYRREIGRFAWFFSAAFNGEIGRCLCVSIMKFFLSVICFCLSSDILCIVCVCTGFHWLVYLGHFFENLSVIERFAVRGIVV